MSEIFTDIYECQIRLFKMYVKNSNNYFWTSAKNSNPMFVTVIQMMKQVIA